MATPLDEGASSVVQLLPDGWVRKTQKRQARSARRTSIGTQLAIHTFVAARLTPTNGYHLLFSPTPRPSTTPNSYEMQRVDTTTDPWFLCDAPPSVKQELDRFAAELQTQKGWRLHDVELYLQPDGRMALLDFDQCFTRSE